jgi:hypothetical protein
VSLPIFRKPHRVGQSLIPCAEMAQRKQPAAQLPWLLRTREQRRRQRRGGRDDHPLKFRLIDLGHQFPMQTSKQWGPRECPRRGTAASRYAPIHSTSKASRGCRSRGCGARAHATGCRSALFEYARGCQRQSAPTSPIPSVRSRGSKRDPTHCPADHSPMCAQIRTPGQPARSSTVVPSKQMRRVRET